MKCLIGSAVALAIAAFAFTGCMFSTEEITQGGWGSLRIGATKTEARKALLEMGAKHVYPENSVRQRVSSVDKLAELAAAEAIILGTGEIVVEFSGDRVSRRHVAGTWRRWESQLNEATTRAETLLVFERILREEEHVVLRSRAAGTRWVGLSEPSREDLDLLARLDRWEGISIDNEEGHWILTLEFKDDRLVRLTIQWSRFA